MKFNKYYFMSAVFCMALASCSDDVTDANKGNQDHTEQADGSLTAASFSFSFSKGGGSRADTGEVGEEGTDGEKAVKNFTLLIFKDVEAHEETNTLEVMKTVTATDATKGASDTEKTINLLVSSGRKRVYILANATKLLGQLGATTTDGLTINKTLLKDFEAQTFEIAYNGGSTDKDGVLGDANGLLMTGVVEADLAPGISATDLGSPTKGSAAEKNVVDVSIDRVSAKISMGVKTVESGTGAVKTFTVSAQGELPPLVYDNNEIAKELGTLPLTYTVTNTTVNAMKFAIFNQNTKEYFVPSLGSLDAAATDGKLFVEDPNYTVKDNGEYGDYFNWTSGTGDKTQVDFYTEYETTSTAPNYLNGKTTKGQPVVNNKADNTATNVFYVAENTNQWATKGNTTYAMVEATFVPEKTRTVDASSAANAFQAASADGNLLFKAKTADVTAGTSFIYCEDYKVFFTTDAGDAGGSITTRHTNTGMTYTSLHALQYIAAKMISDANQHAKGTGDASTSDALKAKMIGEGTDGTTTGYALSTISVTDKDPTSSFTDNQWYAIVKADENRNIGVKAMDAENALYFTITVKRAIKNGTTTLVDAATNNTGDGLGSTKAYIPSRTVTIAVYPQGKCYYRINIEDPAYSSTITPLRYAVVRNYWYQIDLSSFTALGYPNPAIAAGSAEDALGSDTNVKTTITVRPWTVISMNPEVSL